MSRIAIVYFSATGNTQKVLKEMAAASGREVVDVDLTVPAQCPQSLEFGPDDFVIFGAPVHGGLIPAPAAERIARISGKGTPCAVVCTYGNRHYDDALVQMAHIAAEHGFAVQGAAAIVGRHTFGEIAVGRPDADDLAAARSFIGEVLSRPAGSPAPEIPGSYPPKAPGAKGKFRPLTDSRCMHCTMCAVLCPVHAIAPDCTTIGEECISCFRCIRGCPAGAKHMNVPAYNDFVRMFNEKLSARRENAFFA